MLSIKHPLYTKGAPSAIGLWLGQKERSEKEDAISHASAQIGRMTENSLLLFEGAENSAFTVLLSSLLQNNLFSKFIQKHPSPLFEEKKKRLDFNSREEELKAMLHL